MALTAQSKTKTIPPPNIATHQVLLPHLWPLSEHAIKIITAGLLIFDGLLAGLLFILAYWLRHPEEMIFLTTNMQGGLLLVSMPYGFHPDFAPYLSVLFFVPLIQIAMFSYRGLYRVRG